MGVSPRLGIGLAHHDRAALADLRRCWRGAVDRGGAVDLGAEQLVNVELFRPLCHLFPKR